ncbi:MAG TPA: response regulator transcription factor [Pyrinomonadaceae bacterium]|jgi:DNA-binding NarL/FixJ family response regulator|nr:response regulator transcription factor [Pyrinomonadaceae bacterium]
MKEEKQIRVLSVDDHPLMHEGIAALINNQTDMNLVAEASDGRSALLEFREHQPDITLMDLRLPDMNGIDAMISILKEFPNARVIILTMFEGDVEIQRALKSGARGYMLKTMPPKELVKVVRRVHAGKKHIPPEIAANLAEHFSNDALTPRETEVLAQIAEGNRNRDIAERLFISEETVKVHIKHIMDKLDANDRTQAVAIAIRRGIIQL